MFTTSSTGYPSQIVTNEVECGKQLHPSFSEAQVLGRVGYHSSMFS